MSPFADAACCAIDGFGDFVSTSSRPGRGTHIDVLDRVFFPHSLGILYTAVTQYLGFPGYGDEFKVMGLAPYGKPTMVDEHSPAGTLRPAGGSSWTSGTSAIGPMASTMEWEDGYPTLGPVYTRGTRASYSDRPRGRRAADHAATRTSRTRCRPSTRSARCTCSTGSGSGRRIPRLCLAGGCAMNSVANGKIRAHTPFREVYIQPAAGDNGTALGAAYHVWHGCCAASADSSWTRILGPRARRRRDIATAASREPDPMHGFAGRALASPDGGARATARLIADGNVVGWYQGRMEWGARALGNRSIVADPRRADIREIINTKIKFREKFRPFAPSVAVEALDDYFVGCGARIRS